MAFINYAHRGASTYCPENTLLSFYTGVFMGANGIETDVQRTKDGVLVLFHDDTLQRVTGQPGSIGEYTFSQLQEFFVTNGNLQDKIVSFEDFLQHFAFRDLTFAIELKGAGVEKDTVDLIRKYGMEEKTVLTSFQYDYIRTARAYAPEIAIGHLISEVTDTHIENLKAIGAEEICPIATALDKDLVDRLHALGFRVRAWGVANEEIMVKACEAGVDGMTVNFPDKLTAYLQK